MSHLLQVHRSLYNLLLLYLYQRHLQTNEHPDGLFWSTATNNEAVVQHFLHHGAGVNDIIDIVLIRHANMPFLSWFNKQTPLNIAANIGNNKLVTLLLDHGANVYGVPFDRRSTTQPAVVDALLSGHDSTVRLLLIHGSPIQKPGMEPGDLVHCAISRGQVSLLKLLVEFGADLNIPCDGTYPLNSTVMSSHVSTEIAQFLLDNGADISIANGDTGRLLDQVIRGAQLIPCVYCLTMEQPFREISFGCGQIGAQLRQHTCCANTFMRRISKH
jgi:ankyrin repeat protein